MGGPLRESEVKFLTGPAFRRRGLLAVQREFLLGATTNACITRSILDARWSWSCASVTMQEAWAVCT